MPPPTLWIVRHGQTEWSRSGRHTGRSDLPLLDEGCRQAEVAGRLLERQGVEPALVLTSPLSRALQTCHLSGYGVGAIVDDDLVEWDYGSYEGRTTEEIRIERPGWSLWADGVPDGETVSDVGRRADRVIGRARDAGGDVLAFAHGHLLRVLAASWVGLPPVGGRVLGLAPGAVSTLGWERETPVVVGWNVRPELLGRA